MSTLVLRCGSVFNGLSDVLPGTTEDAERVLNTVTPAPEAAVFDSGVVIQILPRDRDDAR